MSMFYKVGVKRNCSANSTQIQVEIELPSDYKLSPSENEKNNQLRSFINTQHPKIAYPCEFDEYEVLYSSKIREVKEQKTISLTKRKSTSTIRKQEPSKPIWLTILLLPLKLVWWALKLFWRIIKREGVLND